MMTSFSENGQSHPVAMVVIGTRPEIIKFAPIIKTSVRDHVSIETVHTGQHYTYEMDSLIFRDLQLPPPHYNLGVGSGTHAEETSKALVGLEALFKKVMPRTVLVLGDTNSTLAGALAATKLHIPVGHVEAGLRSFDRRMPEETNRVLTDHMSNILFAPTELSAKNLFSEGIPSSRTRVTGNTIVDAVDMVLRTGPSRSSPLETPNLQPDDDFFLLTLHREENVDAEERLRSIVKGVAMASTQFESKVIFPAHPRTVKRLHQYGISLPESLVILPPVGYADFLRLERDAQLVLTDSGGVQEEACILGVPCITLRDNTERPETIEVGANLLAGTNPKDIHQGVSTMIENPRKWVQPFGDGRASTRILDTISQNNSW